MKTRTFKLSAIASVAILAACGGGSGSSDPAAAEPAATPPVAVTPTPTPTPTPPAPISVVPSTEPALQAATAFLAKADALRATAIPATGAAVYGLLDGCFLTNGFSKAFLIPDFDAEPLAVASRQVDVGLTLNNVKVMAERSITNADGSARREIDIKYDIIFKDGSKRTATADAEPTETIISGSSSGAKLPDGSNCTSSENKSDWRFYGNRKVINANVAAHNERIDRTTLATGLPVAPAVVYSKYIRFNITDPANAAKYATISGPGIVGGSPLAPITLKLVSVRLLRDSPEFVGKNGNFVDWKDTDPWRVCRTNTGNYATAETADCVANGATGNNWGAPSNAAAATVDSDFDRLGIVAGGAYTVTVYNDDGWKTVNGQFGKAPIATYTAVLNNLPFTAVALAGTGVTTDLFPRVANNSMTPAQIAAAVRARAAFSMNLTFTPPGAMPDGRLLGWGSFYSFKQGKVDAAQGPSNPASRQFDPSYPLANATSATLLVPAAVAKLGLPTFMQYGFAINNRNGNFVQSLYFFQ